MGDRGRCYLCKHGARFFQDFFSNVARKKMVYIPSFQIKLSHQHLKLFLFSCFVITIVYIYLVFVSIAFYTFTSFLD